MATASSSANPTVTCDHTPTDTAAPAHLGKQSDVKPQNKSAAEPAASINRLLDAIDRRLCADCEKERLVQKETATC